MTAWRMSILCLVLVAAGCAAEPPAERPGILLITLDTVRADRLGAYGYDRPTTPRLDALAAEGILFRHAVAQAALTPVSHASILTGLWPPNHGLRVLYAGSGYRLPAEVPTLATVLAQEGYRTAAFLSAFPVSEFFGLQRGFEVFDNGIAEDPEKVLGPADGGAWRFDTAANQRRSDATTDAALAWLRDNGDSANPFFAWVHYWDPHDPWLQPPTAVLEEWVESDPDRRSVWLRELYDAELHYTDAQIGRLLDGLAAAGLGDDTLVLVVSDHGEGLGDHMHWFHRILYQEQIHVPLIARFPGRPGGAVVDAQVRTIDIFPTLLEAAGLKTTTKVDGDSLLPLLEPGAGQDSRPAYAEALIAHDLNAVHLMRSRPDDGILHAWSDGRFKLIHKPLRPERGELYDLLEDPGETDNLYDRRLDVVRRLLTEMETIAPYATDDFGSGDDSEVIERLRSLGYVE